MASHRTRKAAAAYRGKFSKKPGLVSTLGRRAFIRNVIRKRSVCNNGCVIVEVVVVQIVAQNASPIEIPLTFSEPITVFWDDEFDQKKEIIQPGERVVHNYQKPDGQGGKVDADSRDRNISITFPARSLLEVDYSNDEDGYFARHANAISNDAIYNKALKENNQLVGKDGTVYYVIDDNKKNDGTEKFKISEKSKPVSRQATTFTMADEDITSGDQIIDAADNINTSATSQKGWAYILDDQGAPITGGTNDIKQGTPFLISSTDPTNTVTAVVNVGNPAAAGANTQYFTDTFNKFLEKKWTPLKNADLTAAVENLNSGATGGTGVGIKYFKDVKKRDLIIGNDGKKYYARDDADKGVEFEISESNLVNADGTIGVKLQNADLTTAIANLENGAKKDGNEIKFKKSALNISRQALSNITLNSSSKIRSFEGATNLKEIKFQNKKAVSDKVIVAKNLSKLFLDNVNLENVEILDKIDTQAVDNMESMFKNAKKFNSDISKLKTGNVKNMSKMFSGAEKFNKDISNFDTRKVEKTKEMFKNAKKFNKDISKFDLRNVVNDDNMYNGATEMIKPKNSNKKALGGSRKAKDTQTNNVVVESKDKFFVNMQRGDNSFGFVDDKYKKEVDQTDDAFKGLEDSYISTKPKSRAQANNEIDEDGQTQLNEGDRRTRKDQEKKTEMTYNGSKVLGIEIRDEKKVTGGNKDTTQKKLSDDDLYIYLDKETDLKQVEIEDEAGNKVRADVVKVDAGDNAEDEKIANKGISDKKPRQGNQGFHVYKVAKPQANVAKNSWEAIFGNDNDNNKNNKPGEKSFKFFNKK